MARGLGCPTIEADGRRQDSQRSKAKPTPAPPSRKRRVLGGRIGDDRSGQCRCCSRARPSNDRPGIAVPNVRASSASSGSANSQFGQLGKVSPIHDTSLLRRRRRCAARGDFCDLLCERNLVERFFNLLKQFCTVATRYDKLASNFLAGVPAGCGSSLAELWPLGSGPPHEWPHRRPQTFPVVIAQ